MHAWEHVNCCKTIGCRLFGVANSPHYQQRGQNCRCPECGYLFPLISPRVLSAFSQQTNQHYAGVLLCCPRCGCTEALVRHGFDANGKQRWRCRSCHTSFTHYDGPVKYDRKLNPLRDAIAAGEPFRYLNKERQVIRRELSRLAFLAGLEQVHLSVGSLAAEYSTNAFTVGFNASDSLLYIIVTADNKTGRVIAVSGNYIAVSESIGQEWIYPSQAPREQYLSQRAIGQVFDKDRIISRRPLYFDVAYGPATLKRHDRGVVVKPVIAAYRHFGLVHALTNKRVLSVQHWLEHECFLYGACLMANRNEIAAQRSHIGFVYECGSRVENRRLRSDTVLSSIIWRDVWRRYYQRDYELAVCHLTGNRDNTAFHRATLKPARAFQSWLARHPVWPQLIRLAPQNVIYLLNYLAAEYNREC